MAPPTLARPAPSPLAALARDARGVVVDHGTDAATAERLCALGLGLGASFRVLRAGERPVVMVGESRIGLGPDLSRALLAVAR